MTSNPAVVALPLGQIRGLVRETHRVFYNIPYAQAPVGDLRWKAPKKSQEQWEEVKDATKPG
ncbi:Alpha/Beta hydrolase protein [Jimgerdemannia flammicorona]|uniref:Alpha/Beta hydrolase protein n=1 Tax=Jimgerdemannia flammicorona TaxID=994334 RepID=A0A433CWP3_9FUNG|nr:Alpha/Beta hydrolase protein [Jimgerdemannia flammicorona]